MCHNKSYIQHGISYKGKKISVLGGAAFVAHKKNQIFIYWLIVHLQKKYAEKSKEQLTPNTETSRLIIFITLFHIM